VTLRTVELQMSIPKSLEATMNKQRNELSHNNDSNIHAIQLNQEQKMYKSKIMESERSEKSKIKKDGNLHDDRYNKQRKRNKRTNTKKDKKDKENLFAHNLGNYIDIKL